MLGRLRRTKGGRNVEDHRFGGRASHQLAHDHHVRERVRWIAGGAGVLRGVDHVDPLDRAEAASWCAKGHDDPHHRLRGGGRHRSGAGRAGYQRRRPDRQRRQQCADAGGYLHHRSAGQRRPASGQDEGCDGDSRQEVGHLPLLVCGSVLAIARQLPTGTGCARCPGHATERRGWGSSVLSGHAWPWQLRCRQDEKYPWAVHGRGHLVRPERL